MVKLVITIIAHSPIPLKVWFKSTLNRVQKHSRKRHLILQLPEHNLSVFPSCDDVATLFVHPHTCHGTRVALDPLADPSPEEVPDEQLPRLTARYDGVSIPEKAPLGLVRSQRWDEHSCLYINDVQMAVGSCAQDVATVWAESTVAYSPLMTWNLV